MSGARCTRRGVARGGQDEVAGVGIAGHNHAVEGGGERRVAYPGREPALIALGDSQVGAGDRDVDIRLRSVACLESSSASAFLSVAFAAADEAVRLLRHLKVAADDREFVEREPDHVELPHRTLGRNVVRINATTLGRIAVSAWFIFDSSCRDYCPVGRR